MRRRIRHHRHVFPELDITAFMNLMVILVPFLLITAVFSRVTVLDLYLPPASDISESSKSKFRLEIVIRKDHIMLLEAASGLKKKISKNAEEFDLSALKTNLYKLKQKFPKKQEATILAEPDIEYDILVQVMDAIRMREITDGERIKLEALFPGVSIGDAPVNSK